MQLSQEDSQGKQVRLSMPKPPPTSQSARVCTSYSQVHLHMLRTGQLCCPSCVRSCHSRDNERVCRFES